MQANLRKYLYSDHLNTGLIRYSNGLFVFQSGIVRFSNAIRLPDHFVQFFEWLKQDGDHLITGPSKYLTNLGFRSENVSLSVIVGFWDMV
jgi:hypothetical protein